MMYDTHLDRNDANFVPLTPLSFLERAAMVKPAKPAVIYGNISRTWQETYTRCRQLASALAKTGIGRNDTVSILAANIPAMYEAHFGVPMCGAVLNTLNIRLPAESLTFMLEHGESKVLLVDQEFAATAKKIKTLLKKEIYMIDIEDDTLAPAERVGSMEYEDFLNTGDKHYEWHYPENEWDAIALNYNSGTTGKPKGVVYHHRGAALNAINEILTWGIGGESIYLWTLPMFHCNGWCFPWAIASLAGTNICLRKVVARDIYRAVEKYKVNALCGAPVVLGSLLNALPDDKLPLSHKVRVMVAGAAPPAAIIEGMEKEGFDITHVYGLTETYGPSVICEWQEEWNHLPPHEQAVLKARQGVRYVFLDGLTVLDPDTMEPVAKDGETIGEVMMRGNNVMKGYLKNPEATAECFKGGWFHSGDLAVVYPDGYIQIKDRSKDIVISGGENVSTIEVEDVIYEIPEVAEVACVARPDDKWGETVCAFIKLKPGQLIAPDAIKKYCRDKLAGFKVPKTIVFQELPKTATGKIQKFELRKIARELPESV